MPLHRYASNLHCFLYLRTFKLLMNEALPGHSIHQRDWQIKCLRSEAAHTKGMLSPYFPVEFS
jgi:hypothetical protein